MRTLSAFLVVILFSAVPCQAQRGGRRINKSFGGQLAGVAADLKDKIAVDRKLKDSRFRIGKVVSKIPDSNFEPEFERRLAELFKGQLSDDSSFVISGEYSYVEGFESDNRGLSVVELIIRVTDRRGRQLQQARREVNSSDDITLISSVTTSVPDTSDIQKRNDHIEESFDHPRFEVRDQTQIAAAGALNYTVEVLAHRGGQGPAVALRPTRKAGMAFVQLDVADTFEIVVRSYDTTCSTMAEIRIDGLGVASTFSEDGPYPGYLIGKAGSSRKPAAHRVKGWLRTTKQKNDNVYRFVIKEFGQGAASAKKSASNRGVITVRFYQAAGESEKLRGRAFGEAGRGELTSVDYQVVPVQIMDTAESTVNVRYSIPRE